MGLKGEIDKLENAFHRWRQGEEGALPEIQAQFETLRREADTLLKRQVELITLYEIAKELASVVNQDELLQLILTRAIALVQAERGFVVLTDDSPEGFHIAVMRQYSATDKEDSDAQISRSLMQRVISTKTSMVTTNAQEDPRFQASSSIVSYRIRSVMAVPLIYERQVFGAIYVDTRISSRLFAQEDLSLLRGLANQAAVTIRMARLYDHLEARNKQLQQTLAELRATQNELIRSERLSAVGRLASGIIHDFKTPMTTIKGYTAFLGMEDLPANDRRHFSETVIAAVDSLVDMAQEILDFVQGGGELRLEPTLLGEFLSEIIDFLQDDFTHRGITLHTDLAYTGTLSLDRIKLRRVIVNIAGNARDAMDGRPGTFTITSSGKSDYVELTLSDDGPGIPPDILPTIFEPFVTHGKPHGTGLGLAISKKIVEDHNGAIVSQSQPGQGATFIIRLPLV